MSRSGYSEDCNGWELILWRGAVASAIKGERGQTMLKELLAALDAMPEKRLIRNSLQTDSNEVCTLRCLGKAKGFDMSNLDPEDSDRVAKKLFGVAPALVKEVVVWNDESGSFRDTPETLWNRMRAWVAEQITPPERID